MTVDFLSSSIIQSLAIQSTNCLPMGRKAIDFSPPRRLEKKTLAPDVTLLFHFPQVGTPDLKANINVLCFNN